MLEVKNTIVNGDSDSYNDRLHAKWSDVKSIGRPSNKSSSTNRNRQKTGQRKTC